MTAWTDKLDQIGVTHHWRLEETTGATLAARVGGRNLTNNGATIGVDGLMRWETGGKGADFASGDFLSAPDHASLRMSGEWTLGALIEPQSFSDYGTIIRKGDNYWLIISAARQVGGGVVTNQGVFTWSSNDVLLISGNTYLVGFSYELTPTPAVVVWVNGVEVARTAAVAGAVSTVDSSDLTIGNYLADAYTGVIDEPFIVNRALKANDWAGLWDAYAKAPRVPFKRSFDQLAIDSLIDIDATVAQRCSYIVVQQWRTDLRDMIRAANPNCKVLVYQNFGALSTDRHVPTGLSASLINYDEAGAQPPSENNALLGLHPEWFLTSIATGKPFTFDSFPYLYAANVGDPGYRASAAASAIDVLTGDWDGIFADDINPTLGFHHGDPADVAEYPSDVLYQEATIGMLRVVRASTQGAGKLLIANLGSWSGFEAWGRESLLQLDGALDEFRGKFNTSSSDESTYRFLGGWLNEQNHQAYCEYHGKEYLSSTASLTGDERAGKYGYASVQLMSEGRSSWGLHHTYGHQEWLPFMDFDIGAPVDPPTDTSDGGVRIYSRRFTKALIAVNPTDSDNLQLSLASPINVDGVYTTTLSLDSHQAVIAPYWSTPAAPPYYGGAPFGALPQAPFPAPPVPSEFPGPEKPTFPPWRYFLCLSRDMSLIGELKQAKGRSLIVDMNKSGSTSFSYPMETKIAPFIRSWRTCVVAQRGYQEEAVWYWSGPVSNVSRDFMAGTLNIDAIGWFDLLLHRILLERKMYPNWDAGAMAFDLLAYANAQRQTYITPGISEISQPRSRTYEIDTIIGQEIQALSELESGYDWFIDPRTRSLNIVARRGIDRTKTNWLFISEDDKSKGNLRSLVETEDGSTLVNDIYIRGKIASGHASSLDSQQLHDVLFQESVALSDVVDSNILNAYANGEIVYRDNPRLTYSMAPKPNFTKGTPQIFKDYDLGDTTYLTARRGDFKINDQAIRIFGATLSIDDLGFETVTELRSIAS